MTLSLPKTLLVSLLTLATIILISLATGCSRDAAGGETICIVVGAIESSAQCTPVHEKGNDKPQGKFTLPNKNPAEPPTELYCSLEPKRGLKCTPLADPPEKKATAPQPPVNPAPPMIEAPTTAAPAAPQGQ